LAEWLTRFPAKELFIERVGSNPAVVDFIILFQNKIINNLPNKKEWKKCGIIFLLTILYKRFMENVQFNIVKSLSFPIKLYALVGQSYQTGEDLPTFSQRQSGISRLEILSFDKENNSITVKQDNDYTFELGLDLRNNFVSGSGNDPCYIFVSLHEKSKPSRVSRKSSKPSRVSRKSSKPSRVSRKSSKPSRVARKSSKPSRASRKSSKPSRVARKSLRSSMYEIKLLNKIIRNNEMNSKFRV